ncbi:MAG TPA: hypothetical protein VMV21_03715 [Vicinamibacteria bacterium]|nr:hypothetical protein [Vicinamibacteria bacterium]
MRLRLLGLAVALALVFAVLTRGAGSPREAPPTKVPRTPVSARGPAAAGLVEPDPLPPPPARDIFRYAEPAAPPPRPASARATPAILAPPAEPSPPPFPLRLVGLVHRPEGWRAAVATSAGVVLVGPGDAVSGFTVLGIDEERGLHLRGDDGVEYLLTPRS